MNSKMKGMAFALRAERKKTKMLEEEVKQLREEWFDTRAFYSNMEQMLAFAVGIRQGLLTDMSMDDLVDAVNRDYHNRLNEHMDGRLKE